MFQRSELLKVGQSFLLLFLACMVPIGPREKHHNILLSTHTYFIPFEWESVTLIRLNCFGLLALFVPIQIVI